MYVLAIDQGTTNTKALIVDRTGRIHAQASTPSTTDYPHPGWAEQSAGRVWNDTRAVIDAVAAQVNGSPIDAIAISNQRETIVAWDAETGDPVGPAILWQCRRTAPDCAALIVAGHNETVEAATGLGINPMFPASKLAWILKNRPEALDLLDQGRLRAGTVDSWLLWNLTGGTSFATDHSNAARTQLFDTEKLKWSNNLAEIFGTPMTCLADPRPSESRFGETAHGTTALPAGIPIMAMLGDSHAALYGHGVRHPGTVKATYGTGSSLMTLTPHRVASSHGLSGTIAWTDKSGTAYALEGNILVSAQAAAFIAGLLGVGDAATLSDLAQTVATADGVTFVPALSGLGAPHWNDHATGTLAGMTHGTRPAHVARATFEAIALQIADVFEAMQADIGAPLEGLRTDGGASSNAFLMQLQADLLQCPVESAVVEEVSALGAAAMAFSALGVEWLPDARSTRFEPEMTPEAAAVIRATWRDAIRRACS
ncbi:MAG: FGGY-family carbohydrate kinase [Desulfomicrobium sp.]|uniref:FGGY-family carbohydrate kinase n=1 Tax=Hoeflea sp. TaxID=1940281 RepID=UPI0025BEDA89|nr:FGGY-family carbohydrate kinase [Hoeflea sp.]MBU4530886.1 FGGY-family carbohydrate kinase [Alphaproteobacteria bacterium]MBV1713146.1 FGGY-family carbohydrate kinase [Desulfomicrobium sp.]MBU4542337.1 FGGY-family carbohydrate kinase [Alphaproteobacteria bacterium]MBU4551101.1 FGGY-family carbohydrate kinase [Alphaproteobacteria bacterium]MBV1785059.1 FGGY-family carbohydrate kinase [Hoeflea sp.]